MPFLDFYTVDLTIIVILILTYLVIYTSIMYLSNEENKDFNLNYSVISLFAGFLISIMYSYLTLESDVIMTGNYWE